MNPDRHSPRPGSSVYYAIRFAPSPHRAALRAAYEIIHAINAASRETEDPGVASAKLNWWRNELREAALGSAHHPAALQLQTQLKQTDHSCWLALQHCVAAAESDAQQSRYLDETALLRQVQQASGGLSQAVAAILMTEAQAAHASSSDAATGCALVQIIRRLGHDVRRGVLCIPISDLQQFDIKAHEILQIKPGLQQEERFQNLMQHQARRARQYLHLARSGLRAQPRAMRRFNAVLLAHNEELLSALEAANFAVLSQLISLTPLRKLWLAWTAR